MIKRNQTERALIALSKAGWIADSNLRFEPESKRPISVTMTPTKAGGERFRALLILLRELEADCGTLNMDKLGFVFTSAARVFAPDQNTLSWPSKLSNIPSSGDPR